MDFFFYGTLLDPDIQELVIGRRLRPHELESAVVHDHRRVFIRGAWYPVLVPAEGRSVTGRIARGITRREAQLIHYFEDEDYRLETLRVVSRRRGLVATHVYAPRDLSDASDTDWYLEEWRRRFKWQYLRRTRRWMEYDWDQRW